MSGRRCSCGAILRSTNPGPDCSPCEETRRSANLGQIRGAHRDAEERRDAILRMIEGAGATKDFLSVALDVHEKTISNDLIDLIAEGKVARGGTEERKWIYVLGGAA